MACFLHHEIIVTGPFVDGSKLARRIFTCLKACCLIGSAIRLALRTQCGPAIRGNAAVVRHGAAAPSTKSGACSLELSRSPNAGKWLG